MLLGTLGTSLLRNMSSCKRVVRTGYGSKGEGVIRAGYGFNGSSFKKNV